MFTNVLQHFLNFFSCLQKSKQMIDENYYVHGVEPIIELPNYKNET